MINKTRNQWKLRISSSKPSHYARQPLTHVKSYNQSRANRVTATLLLVSCSFLLLNSPYCVVWIVNYVHEFRDETLKSIKEIAELFVLTNFCINSLLYCVSGKIYRRKLMHLLRCQWKELCKRNEGEHRGSYKSRPKNNIQLQEVKAIRSPTKHNDKSELVSI